MNLCCTFWIQWSLLIGVIGCNCSIFNQNSLFGHNYWWTIFWIQRKSWRIPYSACNWTSYCCFVNGSKSWIFWWIFFSTTYFQKSFQLTTHFHWLIFAHQQSIEFRYDKEIRSKLMVAVTSLKVRLWFFSWKNMHFFVKLTLYIEYVSLKILLNQKNFIF